MKEPVFSLATNKKRVALDAGIKKRKGIVVKFGIGLGWRGKKQVEKDRMILCIRCYD